MRVNSILFFVLIIILNVASSAVYAQLRIVCIGNSITQGKIGLRSDSSYELSYRPWLWEKLLKTGFVVDMVGFHPYFFDESEGNLTMKFETNWLAFDRDCEAYYGITSSEFVNGSASTGWTSAPLPEFKKRMNDLQKGYTPDVALIHIGTNDPDSTSEQVTATRNNVMEIIRVLRDKNPSIVILVAKLITGWKKINGQIDGLCAELNTVESPVVAVDLANGFINDPQQYGSMTYDYVHPNKTGQLFMMERWYNGIVQNLRDLEPPELEGKPVIVKRSGGDVTFSWRAANDNYGIKSYEIFIEGSLVGETSQNFFTYTFKRLRRAHTYKISVKAKDWSGNLSNEIVAGIQLKQ
jgi:lysophospholipase L1-like esterase